MKSMLIALTGMLAGVTDAQLITTTHTSCKSPLVDDEIKITPLCEGGAALVFSTFVSPDCDLYQHLWKLSLRPSEVCMIDDVNFGKAFQYKTHCNSDNIMASYTKSEYVAGQDRSNKAECEITGTDIPIASGTAINNAGLCDMVISVRSSAPLNITDTTDCFFYEVMAFESARYLVSAVSALALMVVANTV